MVKRWGRLCTLEGTLHLRPPGRQPCPLCNLSCCGLPAQLPVGLALPRLLCGLPAPASLTLTDTSGQIMAPEYAESCMQPTFIEHRLYARACAKPGGSGSLKSPIFHAHFPAPISVLKLKAEQQVLPADQGQLPPN